VAASYLQLPTMTGADMQQLAACSSLIPHSTRSNAEVRGCHRLCHTQSG
jgi:hypothetical protein